MNNLLVANTQTFIINFLWTIKHQRCGGWKGQGNNMLAPKKIVTSNGPFYIFHWFFFYLLIFHLANSVNSNKNMISSAHSQGVYLHESFWRWGHFIGTLRHFTMQKHSVQLHRWKKTNFSAEFYDFIPNIT